MRTISDIVIIRTGPPFREWITPDPANKFLIVQGKDTGSDGDLVIDAMVRVATVPGQGRPDTKQPEVHPVSTGHRL